jgi:DNA-directed RNA polymerase subunit alpha
MRNVPFKLNVDEPKIVRIEQNSAGEILSGDIITDSDVEVLDKNIHIAYLEEGGEFRAEMIVKKGTGFSLAEQNYDDSLPVDFIAVDANFNPVEKVKYTIEPARVGKKTDYEKLIVEIWTNGSISPRETISMAGKILRDHLAICLDYQDMEKILPTEDQDTEMGIESKFEYLEKSVESMGLSVRALKCLKKLGVDYIYELVEKTEHELLNSKNFGKKSLEEIIAKLGEYEMVLGQKLPENIVEELEEKLAKKKPEEAVEISEPPQMEIVEPENNEDEDEDEINE